MDSWVVLFHEYQMLYSHTIVIRFLNMRMARTCDIGKTLDFSLQFWTSNFINWEANHLQLKRENEGRSQSLFIKTDSVEWKMLLDLLEDLVMTYIYQ